jgi:hypothetical protein
VRNPVFVEDRVKADLVFFKDRCSPRYLNDIKRGQARSVSIGFFWECVPYPNEHSCRLRDPETLDIVGSGERKHNGKTYRVIFGKPKGEKDAGSVEQAYRYPVETWSETEARKHCQDHDGAFEPATGKEGDKKAQDRKTTSLTQKDTLKRKLKEIAKRKETIESADAIIVRIKALMEQLHDTF